jgi:hypothetical protein
MARSRAEQQIERNAEASSNEPHTLQNAKRTGKFAEPDLIDERENQDGINRDQAQRVERS